MKTMGSTMRVWTVSVTAIVVGDNDPGNGDLEALVLQLADNATAEVATQEWVPATHSVEPKVLVEECEPEHPKEWRAASARDYNRPLAALGAHLANRRCRLREGSEEVEYLYRNTEYLRCAKELGVGTPADVRGAVWVTLEERAQVYTLYLRWHPKTTKAEVE